MTGQAVRPLPGRPAIWLVVAAVLTLAACSPDGAESTAPTTAGRAASTTTASTTTTAATEDPKAAVLAAYRAFWDDVVAVGATADWRSPRLADHATGSALQQLRTQFRAVKAEGWIAKGNVKISPQVASVSGTKATIRDCVDTTRYGRYDPNAGQWIDQPGGQPDAERVQLVLTQGAWKVAETVVTGECRG
jgi:hypothetical protein